MADDVHSPAPERQDEPRGQQEPLLERPQESVIITQVVSPGRIWAIPAFTPRFQELERKMVATCTEQMYQLKAELRVRPGLICVYHRVATDRWYRARVIARLRRSEGLCAQVLLLDYGERQTVLDADLFSLPEPYCNLDQLPAQAVRVRLAGVRPLQMEYTITDEGKVVGTMERAGRWSEAACAVARRLLTPGTPCLLETVRWERGGTRRGHLRLVGAARSDVARCLVDEGVAQTDDEGDTSSPSEDTELDETSLVAEPSRRQQEVLDSDDDSDPPPPPGAEGAEGAADGTADVPPVDRDTFLAEQRRAEEEFRRLQEQRREQEGEQNTAQLEEQRSKLQRSLAGLLLTEEQVSGRPATTAPVGRGRGALSSSRSPGAGGVTSPSRPEVLSADETAAASPLSPRGRTALSPTSVNPAAVSPGLVDTGVSPRPVFAAGVSPRPGSAGGISSGSEDHAASPGPGDSASTGALAAALRQLRSSSSGDDRPAPALLPAGQTSSARQATIRQAEAERRQRDYEERLRRRAERFGTHAPPPVPRAEKIIPLAEQLGMDAEHLVPQQTQQVPPAAQAVSPVKQPMQQPAWPAPQPAQPLQSSPQRPAQQPMPRAPHAVPQHRRPIPHPAQSPPHPAQSPPQRVLSPPRATQAPNRVNTSPTKPGARPPTAALRTPPRPPAGITPPAPVNARRSESSSDGTRADASPSTSGGQQKRSGARFERIPAGVWRQKLLGMRAKDMAAAGAAPAGAGGTTADTTPQDPTPTAERAEETKLTTEPPETPRPTAGPPETPGSRSGPPGDIRPTAGVPDVNKLTSGPHKLLNKTSAVGQSEKPGPTVGPAASGSPEMNRLTAGPPEVSRSTTGSTESAGPPVAPLKNNSSTVVSQEVNRLGPPATISAATVASPEVNKLESPAITSPAAVVSPETSPSVATGGRSPGRLGSVAERMRRLVKQRELQAAAASAAQPARPPTSAAPATESASTVTEVVSTFRPAAAFAEPPRPPVATEPLSPPIAAVGSGEPGSTGVPRGVVGRPTASEEPWPAAQQAVPIAQEAVLAAQAVPVAQQVVTAEQETVPVVQEPVSVAEETFSPAQDARSQAEKPASAAVKVTSPSAQDSVTAAVTPAGVTPVKTDVDGSKRTTPRSAHLRRLLEARRKRAPAAATQPAPTTETPVISVTQPEAVAIQLAHPPTQPADVLGVAKAIATLLADTPTAPANQPAVPTHSPAPPASFESLPPADPPAPPARVQWPSVAEPLPADVRSRIASRLLSAASATQPTTAAAQPLAVTAQPLAVTTQPTCTTSQRVDALPADTPAAPTTQPAVSADLPTPSAPVPVSEGLPADVRSRIAARLQTTASVERSTVTAAQRTTAMPDPPAAADTPAPLAGLPEPPMPSLVLPAPPVEPPTPPAPAQCPPVAEPLPADVRSRIAARLRTAALTTQPPAAPQPLTATTQPPAAATQLATKTLPADSPAVTTDKQSLADTPAPLSGLPKPAVPSTDLPVPAADPPAPPAPAQCPPVAEPLPADVRNRIAALNLKRSTPGTTQPTTATPQPPAVVAQPAIVKPVAEPPVVTADQSASTTSISATAVEPSAPASESPATAPVAEPLPADVRSRIAARLLSAASAGRSIAAATQPATAGIQPATAGIQPPAVTADKPPSSADTPASLAGLPAATVPSPDPSASAVEPATPVSDSSAAAAVQTAILALQADPPTTPAVPAAVAAPASDTLAPAVDCPTDPPALPIKPLADAPAPPVVPSVPPGAMSAPVSDPAAPPTESAVPHAPAPAPVAEPLPAAVRSRIAARLLSAMDKGLVKARSPATSAVSSATATVVATPAAAPAPSATPVPVPAVAVGPPVLAGVPAPAPTSIPASAPATAPVSAPAPIAVPAPAPSPAVVPSPATPAAAATAASVPANRQPVSESSDDDSTPPPSQQQARPPRPTTPPPQPSPPPLEADPRASLGQLMSRGTLSEQAPPAGAAGGVAASASSRSESSLLRVLVNGRRRVAPYWRTEQMPFVDMLMQKLRPLSFRPSRVQAYLWPAVARYRSVVAVGQAGSGKTLGYLLAVVNSLLDTETYEHLPSGHGPLCLVLVPSWRRGRAVQQLCQAATDSLRCHPLLVHGGGAEAEQEVSLMNGCHLLIGTPACLLRLLRRGHDTFLQLRRVCHLVLDDAHLLAERCTEPVEQLAMAVFALWRARSEQAAALPQQVIVAASHWTEGLRVLTRQLADPVVVTSCYMEQLVWARPRVFTHLLEDGQKDRKLLGLLEMGLHRQRLVIFTSSDSSAQRLATLLRAQSYPVLLADGEQLGASLNELERCWWSSGGSGGEGACSDVLVVSDTVVAELAVRDARTLIHYDVPTEKRTQLGLRCSYMIDSYPDRLTKPDAENPCVVHLFVSQAAADAMGAPLRQLLVRLGAPVPSGLAPAARRPQDAELCPQLLACGRCADRLGCPHRHWLHAQADAAHQDLPQHGELTVSVTHVLDAATLSVRLLSVRERREDRGAGDGEDWTVRELEDACCRLELDVCAHYSAPAHRVIHELPQVGDVCGLEWDGMFVRVRVTALDAGSDACSVLLIDFGNTETVQRSRLLSLPSPLAEVPDQAVTVHLCGVQPIDGDWDWTDGATRLTEQQINGQVAMGKVVLALSRHLWLSPLVRRRHHQLYQTSATLMDPSLASQLLDAGFGQRAPGHMETLYELCRRAELPVHPQWKPSDRRKLYQTEFLPLVTSLKTNSSVNITNVTSPADFYVQRNDVFPQYEQLMSDLNAWAEGPQPPRLPAYRHRVKQHCVAQFPEDGRWYRARVLSVLTDEAADSVTYEVLYTDVGDQATVDESRVLPLPERFAKRLPLQALRCELAFCSPAAEDGVWSEEACDTLYDMSLDEQQLWVPYHCQVLEQSGGRYRVVLYDPERHSVAQKLADAGLVKLDEQEQLGAPLPQFPVLPGDHVGLSADSLDSLDSDDSDFFDHAAAERGAGVTYRSVLENAPKVDGVPVMQIGDFEVVGFPFSRLARESAGRSGSSADSIEVIDPGCAELAETRQPAPPPVKITEIADPPTRPAREEAARSDDDWEHLPAAQPVRAAPLPPPLAFAAEAPAVRTPRVTWWQDGQHVRLYIHLSDVRQPLVEIQANHFHFSCTQADCEFAVALQLFSAVRPADSGYQVLGARVQVKLRKDKALSWRRLTATPVKARWLQHDLDHVGAGGDSSSDETFRLVADPPAPVSLPSLPVLQARQRGRAPHQERREDQPGAAAGGGGDHSGTSDSGEDMEQELGGCGPGERDVELLNDPQAVRELLQPDRWATGDHL